MAKWVMECSGAAPCQCHSPGGHQTVSPGRMRTTSPSRVPVRPTPSVTCRVWPSACRCHAVRAPGVNHSAGPCTDGCFGRNSTLCSSLRG